MTLALITEGRPIVILRPGTAERGAGRWNPPETKLRGGEFAGVAFRTLQWVFRAVIWCKRKSSPRVTHLGRKRGAVTLWAAGAVRAAALRGGAHRRAACWPLEGAAAYGI